MSAHAVQAAPAQAAAPSRAPPPVRRAAIPVDRVDDPLEHEADRMAERFRRPGSSPGDAARSFLGRDVVVRTDAEAARRLKSDGAGTSVTGTTVGTGYWLFGDDAARPSSTPSRRTRSELTR